MLLLLGPVELLLGGFPQLVLTVARWINDIKYAAHRVRGFPRAVFLGFLCGLGLANLAYAPCTPDN